jgi:hypothetical protein
MANDLRSRYFLFSKAIKEGNFVGASHGSLELSRTILSVIELFSQ